MTLLVLAGLVFAFVGGRRLLHIYLTSTGRQAADVPSKQDYPVRGVDLSYYQGNIDWDVLASQGVDFCFIKATEGIDHNDSQFAQNWETAQSAQIYVGACLLRMKYRLLTFHPFQTRLSSCHNVLHR